MSCEAVHTLAVRLMRPLAVLSSIAVSAASLAPAHAIPTLAPDYTFHFASYAGISLVWLLAAVWCPGQQSVTEHRSRRLRASVVLVAVALTGTVLELVQHHVGRTSDSRDLLANLVGVGTGWAVWTRVVLSCDLAHARAERAVERVMSDCPK